MNFITSVLSSDGKISSKRLITLLAFLLVAIAFISDLFFGKTISEFLFDGVIYVVWAGLGVVVGEHLLKKKNGEDPKGEVLSAEPIEDESDSEESEEDKEEKLGDN